MNSNQPSIFNNIGNSKYKKKDIIPNVRKLIWLHGQGLLGGERMPEDENPSLDKDSNENYLYFTLPMALNYQRNSYKLWESAKITYLSSETRDVFNPELVLEMSDVELQNKLTYFKLAIQKNKHPKIWRTINSSIMKFWNGDIRILFSEANYSVERVLTFIQQDQKKLFPYLSGPKIANYWLYVMENYTNIHFSDLDRLSIAPDTHVIQASKMLGLFEDNVAYRDTNPPRTEVATMWREILSGTELSPIMVHTPLWLWSRNGFIDLNAIKESEIGR